MGRESSVFKAAKLTVGSYWARSWVIWEEPFSTRAMGGPTEAAWALEYPGCILRYVVTRCTTRSRATKPNTALPHLSIPGGSFMV